MKAQRLLVMLLGLCFAHGFERVDHSSWATFEDTLPTNAGRSTPRQSINIASDMKRKCVLLKTQISANQLGMGHAVFQRLHNQQKQPWGWHGDDLTMEQFRTTVTNLQKNLNLDQRTVSKILLHGEFTEESSTTASEFRWDFQDRKHYHSRHMLALTKRVAGMPNVHFAFLHFKMQATPVGKLANEDEVHAAQAYAKSLAYDECLRLF